MSGLPVFAVNSQRVQTKITCLMAALRTCKTVKFGANLISELSENVYMIVVISGYCHN